MNGFVIPLFCQMVPFWERWLCYGQSDLERGLRSLWDTISHNITRNSIEIFLREYRNVLSRLLWKHWVRDDVLLWPSVWKWSHIFDPSNRLEIPLLNTQTCRQCLCPQQQLRAVHRWGQTVLFCLVHHTHSIALVLCLSRKAFILEDSKLWRSDISDG